MNYNIFTYTIYFLLLLFVVLYVGSALYRNGRPFLVNTFKGNSTTADAVNKFLLSGYYLMNIGYTVIALRIWDSVDSFMEMINVLSLKIGTIVLTLGVMHIFNVITLAGIGKNRKNSINNTNPSHLRKGFGG